MGMQAYPQPSQQPNPNPGVVLIPVGLLLTVIIAVARLLLAPAAKNNHSNIDITSFNSGNMHLAQGDYDMALIDFNMVISSDPDFAEAYNSRGAVYEARGDYARALADFDRAIELLPDSAMCYNNRGITYFAQGEYDRAIADLDKAIQLEADFAKAYYNRGLVYRATGNPDAAIADFDQAIQFTSAFGLLSSHNVIPGPAKDRLGVLDAYRLQQADDDLPSVYFYRGLAYSGKGDSIRAIADLQKALELGLETELAEQANALLAALPFTTAAASAPKPGHWEGVS